MKLTSVLGGAMLSALPVPGLCAAAGSVGIVFIEGPSGPRANAGEEIGLRHHPIA